MKKRGRLSVSKYHIIRFKKHKTRGSIAGVLRHQYRQDGAGQPRPDRTINADPERTKLNTNKQADMPGAMAAINNRIAEFKSRKDSVLAVEVMITCSPGALATAADYDNYLNDSIGFLRDEFGDKNVVSYGIQHDETTPHLWAMVVPGDDQTGNLNAKKWFGDRGSFARLRDDHYNKVGRAHGLKANRLNANVSSYSKAAHGGMIKGAERISAEIKKGTMSPGEEIETIVKLAHGYQHQEFKIENQQMQIDSLTTSNRKYRELADRLRETSFLAIVRNFGGKRDRYDRNKYHVNGLVLSIDEEKQLFHNHATGEGGHGAIDLIMTLNQCDFDETMKWLQDFNGQDQPVADYLAHGKQAVKKAVARPSPLPPARSKSTAALSGYLLDRGIDQSMINELLASDQIYEDEKKNIRFRHMTGDNGRISEEIIGTNPRKPFKGSLGRKTGFFISDKKPAAVYVVESAIDALSLFQLRRKEGPCAVISTGGLNKTLARKLTKEYQEIGIDVYAAQDADAAGDKQAAQMLELGAMRLRPNAKDWNDVLNIRIKEADQIRIAESQQTLTFG